MQIKVNKLIVISILIFSSLFFSQKMSSGCQCPVGVTSGPTLATLCGGSQFMLFMGLLEVFIRSQCDLEDPCGRPKVYSFHFLLASNVDFVVVFFFFIYLQSRLPTEIDNEYDFVSIYNIWINNNVHFLLLLLLFGFVENLLKESFSFFRTDRYWRWVWRIGCSVAPL